MLNFRCWSRSTQTLQSHLRLYLSWTLLSMISLREFLLRLASLHNKTWGNLEMFPDDIISFCSQVFTHLLWDPNCSVPPTAWRVAKHAVSEGTKVVTKYTSSKKLLMPSVPLSLQPHCTHILTLSVARHSFNSRKYLAVAREEIQRARPSPAQAELDFSCQGGESTGFSGKLMCKSFF